jgi:serine O-acetyltransferase
MTAGAPGLRTLVREDLLANRGALLSPGFHALAVYRFGQVVTVLPQPVRWPLWRLYRWAFAFVCNVYHVELPHTCRIGRRLRLPHPHGVVVVSGAVVGDDCRFRHNVTIGEGSPKRGGWPTLGDRVDIGPGAIVMGDVTVGDGVLIGPNAVVIDDVAAGMRVLAPVGVARAPRPAQGAGA